MGCHSKGSRTYTTKGRNGTGGKAAGGAANTVEQKIAQAKQKGVFDTDWQTFSVDNPALSVVLRTSTATPETLEAIMKKTLKDSDSIENEVQKLKDGQLSFEIQIPKYGGTDNQKRYAQNLAEAYAIDFSNAVAGRWQSPTNRKVIKQTLQKEGIKPTANNYVKYMVEKSKTLKAVQNSKNAADIISALKGKVNPNARSYNDAPQGFEMRKGRKF